MDLTKWLNLWEKCPELRPSGVGAVGPDEDLWELESSPGCWDPVSRRHLEAIFGFWAMKWLCAVDCEPMLFNAVSCSVETGRSIEQVSLWSVILCGRGDENSHPEFTSDNPTEALYLAVCKVLEMEP